MSVVHLQVAQTNNTSDSVVEIYFNHLRKAALYCSIVVGCKPDFNHSLLNMVSLNSSDSLSETQSREVSRKRLSIWPLSFLLCPPRTMSVTCCLVWGGKYVLMSMSCSYDRLAWPVGLTGQCDRSMWPVNVTGQCDRLLNSATNTVKDGI